MAFIAYPTLPYPTCESCFSLICANQTPFLMDDLEPSLLRIIPAQFQPIRTVEVGDTGDGLQNKTAFFDCFNFNVDQENEDRIENKTAFFGIKNWAPNSG